VLAPLPPNAESALVETGFPPSQQLRLLARYGTGSTQIFLDDACSGTIPNTHFLWAELRQAARAEGVIHLDDLLLRRVRIGLLAPDGSMDLLPRIRAIVQPELDWDDARWEKEASEYAALWKRAYALN
jgi:glycerol-3-phosphate dehydrogenase